MKINLIKADSVHSKENSGILPSASPLPASWVKGTGFGAWRARAGVLAPSLSCVTMGTSAKGARVSLALQNCHRDLREDGEAASPWWTLNAQPASRPSCLAGSSPTCQPNWGPAEAPQEEPTFLLHLQILPPRALAAVSGGGGSREGESKTLPLPTASPFHSYYCPLSCGPGSRSVRQAGDGQYF